jgi:hypothetical protein
MSEMLLRCDGCGQAADSAHISRRLERLAWATRFRPVHIQALLLGGLAPRNEDDFLYSPWALFQGEAGAVLKAVQISAEGKATAAVLAEFQKLGLLLTHVLECPLEEGVSEAQAQALIEEQLPTVMTRVRRSLKPKRVLLVSRELQPYARKFHEADLGCPVLPGSGCFLAGEAVTESDLLAFRAALATSNVQTV